MPPPSKVCKKKILDVLCQFNVFDDKNELYSRENPIWKEICSQGIDLNPHTLNLYLRMDRQNLQTDLRKRLGLPENSVRSNESLDTTDETQKNSPNYSIFTQDKRGKENVLPDIHFSIDIDKEVWSKIAPVKKLCRNRFSQNLQDPWTDIIAKLVYSKTKLPCAFNFKRAIITDIIYLKIIAYCVECGSKLKGHCVEPPFEGAGISIAFTASDSRGIPHSKKRQLHGLARINVGKDLLSKKASIVRKEATTVMEYGDPEPSFIPGNDVLRKARQEASSNDMGIKKGLDMISSLHNMKYDGEFAGYIREIGLDEFFLIYMSPMQVATYKDKIKSIKRVSIDATGNVVKPILKPNGETKYVLLYQMVMQGDEGIYPISQMLSTKQDTNSITYWLKMFLKLTRCIPEEASCDFSLALLNAITLSFNECRLNVYLELCFSWLKTGHKCLELPCFVRLDIAHLIKTVCKKDVFQHKQGKVKDFYVRCVGIMSCCETIENFEEVLSSTLVVALSECDGQKEDGEYLKSQQCENYLLQKIKTFSYDDKILLNEEDITFPDDVFKIGDGLSDFVLNILHTAMAQASECKNFERPNPYFLPGITDHIMKLAKYFVLWTNVMKQKFDSPYEVGTSACSEAYFKDMKSSQLFPYHGPIRSDKFFVKHIRSIEATCKLEKAASKRKKETSEIVGESIIENKQKEKQNEIFLSEINIGHMFEEEGWKGKTKPSAVTTYDNSLGTVQNKLNRAVGQRGKYLNPCPDIEIIHNRPTKKRSTNILQNGITVAPVWINKKLIQIKNTCPFDSLAEILSSAYAENAFYRTAIDSIIEHCPTTKIVKQYAKNGPTADVYKERALLLSTIFETKNSSLLCEGNITNLIHNLLQSLPSATQTASCKCGLENKYFVTIELDMNDAMSCNINLGLQKYIANFFSTKKTTCKICSDIKILERSPDIHLIFDFEFALNKNFHKQFTKNARETISLAELPTKIFVLKKTYILSGAIEHIQTIRSELGHYVAHCRRVNDTWEIRDDMTKDLKISLCSKKKERKICIVFYTKLGQ